MPSQSSSDKLEAQRYRYLRDIWAGLVTQVRFGRDDEPVDRVYVVRIGESAGLKAHTDPASFDKAVDAAMSLKAEKDHGDQAETLPTV